MLDLFSGRNVDGPRTVDPRTHLDPEIISAITGAEVIVIVLDGHILGWMVLELPRVIRPVLERHHGGVRVPRPRWLSWLDVTARRFR